jgi:hypothetical protein
MIFFSERFDDFSVKGLGAPVISAGNTQKAGTDENCFHERKLLFEKLKIPNTADHRIRQDGFIGLEGNR